MKHELTSKGLCWTNIQSPEPEELAEFVRSIELTASDAEFIAQDHHRPEITVRPNYIMLLLHVPIFDRTLRITTGAPLYFVIKQGRLFSLHYDPIVSLDKIRGEFEASRDRQEEYFGDEAMSLCLYILTLLYDSAFKKLERLAKHIDIAEDAVFQGNERKMVEEISILARDVMDFRKVIRPQSRLFFSAPAHPFITPDARTSWHRVHSQLLKIWEVLEGMFESVRELSSTNITLLQHKENQLLRLLTFYSIVIMPVWIFIAPFDPFAEDATTLSVTLFWGVCVVLTIALFLIFFRFRGKRIL